MPLADITHKSVLEAVAEHQDREPAIDHIIYALEPLPAPAARVVYLAGPVSRDPADPGWHHEAVRELRTAGHRGVIIVPRPRLEDVPDPLAQTRWEHVAMARADALLFWIPRVLWSLPGLTTNLEWGIWHDSGKAVLGAPPDAPRMRYLRYYADLAGAPQAGSLREAARYAVDLAAGRTVTQRTRADPAE